MEKDKENIIDNKEENFNEKNDLDGKVRKGNIHVLKDKKENKEKEDFRQSLRLMDETQKKENNNLIEEKKKEFEFFVLETNNSNYEFNINDEIKLNTCVIDIGGEVISIVNNTIIKNYKNGWLGLYEINANNDDYYDYKYLYKYPSGEISFQTPNYYGNFFFKLFKGNFEFRLFLNNKNYSLKSKTFSNRPTIIASLEILDDKINLITPKKQVQYLNTHGLVFTKKMS
jgi:hypothetical protein